VRDQELFAEAKLRCVIADEAQHAKNRRTQAAAALRALSAEARFCLTGTPVENYLDDLRSLFDIVLPAPSRPSPRRPAATSASSRAAPPRQTAPTFSPHESPVATELPPTLEQSSGANSPTSSAPATTSPPATDREIDALAYDRRPDRSPPRRAHPAPAPAPGLLRSAPHQKPEETSR
jgi:hypothetical protein